VAVRPEYAPLAAVRQWARTRKDWDYLEIDAGHDAMVTSPDTVADLLLRIAAPRQVRAE
jgi:hypothetical protein